MAGKDRKKQLARQRYERQQQRMQAEAARTRRLKIIGSVAGVAVIAVGGTAAMVLTKDDKDDKPATPAKAAGAQCAYKPAKAEDAPKGLGTPPVKPARTGMVQATVKTSEGDIVMELDGAKAPCTVNSIVFLAQKNYFDNTPCHRLTSGSLNVLQCGDPKGTGMGGPGYQFANENTEGAKYTKGTLAMANSGPDTNGSQFFMVYADSQLQPGYSVFGKITKGIDVLEKIGKAGSNPPGEGKPKKKVTIQDVAIAGQ
ncbi:peptidylprolyl isomerase [Actinomadura rubrisoli]|uniref:Peptidyl-prolyl cis-trans isomerase n=1 Tax=Actinomadura rubrisoli TaxID=2530368 RepID=A0A4R5A9V5_9ACTN|nr:peptidylprolyl isomerase [Actinomadura rubrisoli]TDD69043.1 peptidylprolyl isomerase [Actinomadura rubrisoli]